MLKYFHLFPKFYIRYPTGFDLNYLFSRRIKTFDNSFFSDK
jgi:hypothetical protein